MDSYVFQTILNKNKRFKIIEKLKAAASTPSTNFSYNLTSQPNTSFSYNLTSSNDTNTSSTYTPPTDTNSSSTANTSTDTNSTVNSEESTKSDNNFSEPSSTNTDVSFSPTSSTDPSVKFKTNEPTEQSDQNKPEEQTSAGLKEKKRKLTTNDSYYEAEREKIRFARENADSFYNKNENDNFVSDDINSLDYEENLEYKPSKLDYDPNQVAREEFLKTGDDSYLYGNKFPKGSEEHIKWASIFEPGRYHRKSSQLKSALQNLFKIIKSAKFDNSNQNNIGFNQYNNPNKTDTEVSNALNTTAPVNGAYSTSNMEQAQPTGALTNYNSVTNNANPTGQNGINTANQNKSNNSTSYITQTTVNIDTFKNKLNSTPQPQIKMNESVVDSVKKQLQEMGKEFERKEGKATGQEATVNNVANQQKLPISMDEAKREIEKLPKEMFKSLEIAEDGYIEEDANQLPLAAEKEKEVEQFFQPDEMVEKMDQKSLKIKQLLKSLNSVSETEAIFKDIKNAKKYAKIYNTKIAAHNEKAYVVTPTLKDINTFGKRIFKVDVKKY